MRIIFMGTPEFAVPSLQILLENEYDVVGVITATDKYGGRGKKMLLESAVKKFAFAKGLKVLQPPNLKAGAFTEELAGLKADLQIIVAFRMLPEIVWNMPPLGSYNLHGSLLPQYRGAAPIHWAVMHGDTETGVTTFKLKHEIDTGDMLIQKSMPIYFTDTAGDVHDRMKHLGAETVLETVKLIKSGEFSFTKQDNSKVSKAPKIHKEMCEIDFNRPSLQIYNHIRGLNPFPGAWTKLDKKLTKVFSSEFEICGHQLRPGTILSRGNNVLKVASADGFIHVKELQMGGRKRMSTKEFLTGYQNITG